MVETVTFSGFPGMAWSFDRKAPGRSGGVAGADGELNL